MLAKHPGRWHKDVEIVSGFAVPVSEWFLGIAVLRSQTGHEHVVVLGLYVVDLALRFSFSGSWLVSSFSL